MGTEAVAPGTVLGGDFRVIEPLSAGGMGALFVAEQLSTGKRRALKVMHAGLLESGVSRERFQREARIGSLVKSDHVVEVVSAGVDPAGNLPFIAMELLEGEDLARHVGRVGPLPPERVLDLMGQVCHALGAAHAVGVVHRDIKPENVFIVASRTAASGSFVKLLDFGIAKIAAGMRTTNTGVIGTPLWMAPEQTDPTAEAGPPADVWASGLLAFWMLTGRAFWRSAVSATPSIHALMREILFEPIPFASARAAELGAEKLPVGFDAWLLRALSRDPTGRYRDANEAFAELARALGPGGATLVSPAFTAVSLAPPPRPEKPRSRLVWVALPVLGLGLLGALAALGIGGAYLGGLFDEAPSVASSTPTRAEPTPSSPVPSAEPAPLAPSASPSAVKRPVAMPLKGTSAPSAAPAPAPSASAAPKPFDHAAASKALNERASFAKLSCSNKKGPRAYGPTVQFRNNGTVFRVTMSPTDMASDAGICVHMILSGARVPPYDGPLQSAGVGVALNP